MLELITVIGSSIVTFQSTLLNTDALSQTPDD
jgi:hypothetical protein